MMCYRLKFALLAAICCLAVFAGADTMFAQSSSEKKSAEKAAQEQQREQLERSLKDLQIQMQRQAAILERQEALLHERQVKAQQELNELRSRLAESQAQYAQARATTAAVQAAADYRKLAVTKQETVSDYWIGVQCEPAGETPILSDVPHLGRLFRKDGLKVQVVTPNSPAEKAGLKAGDVMIAAGKIPLKGIGDLLKAVGEYQKQPLTLQIIRKEKTRSVKVTPEKRPAKVEPDQTRLLWSEAANRWKTNQWRSFPKDLDIKFEKKGQEPARIEVVRGENSWTAKETDLGDLPKDIRARVQRTLRALNAAHDWQAFQNWTSDPNTYNQYNAALGWYYGNRAKNGQTTNNLFNLWRTRAASEQQTSKNLQQKVDALIEHVQQLQKSVERLKKE